MKAIQIKVTGSDACVIEKPVLTSGTVGQPVEFTFDEAWEGLGKTAVFRAGSRSYPVSCVQNAAVVPWEVLEKGGVRLYIGVLGADEKGIIKIPTVWVFVDTIVPGTQIPDTVPEEPTPDVYEQILAAANKAVETAESVRADADSGKFIGPPGDAGKTPEKGIDYWTLEEKNEIKKYIDESIPENGSNGGSGSFQKFMDYTVPEGETLGIGVYKSDVIVLEDIDVSQVIIATEVPAASAFPTNSTDAIAGSGLMLEFAENGVFAETGVKASIGIHEKNVTYGQTEFTILPGAFIIKGATGYNYNGPNIATNTWGPIGMRPVTASGKATGLRLTEGYPNGQILPAGSRIIIYGR